MSRRCETAVTDFRPGSVASFDSRIIPAGACLMTTAKHNRIYLINDNDLHKGACEEDNARQKPQARFKGQLSHRESDPLIKSSDSDFPEPGSSPEHSGEPEA
ncbi:MAG: hypothetical protein ACLPXM_20530 [Terriglobales bacterium]